MKTAQEVTKIPLSSGVDAHDAVSLAACALAWICNNGDTRELIIESAKEDHLFTKKRAKKEVNKSKLDPWNTKPAGIWE